jgi:hypothetical protein
VKINQKRFDEIAKLAEAVDASKKAQHNPYSGSTSPSLDEMALTGWIVRAQALINDVCGADSTHAKHFEKAKAGSSFTYQYERFQNMSAVLLATKADFEGGYLLSQAALVEAVIFSDELEQATELVRKTYKVAAAVIAGVVLESALRRLCEKSRLPSGTMDRMNADLFKAGVYNLLQQKRITALAQLRNDAAHGNGEAFAKGDVEAMIADISRFLTGHLA